MRKSEKVKTTYFYKKKKSFFHYEQIKDLSVYVKKVRIYVIFSPFASVVMRFFSHSSFLKEYGIMQKESFKSLLLN